MVFLLELLRSFSLLLIFLAFAGVIYRFLLPAGRVSDTAKAVLSAVTLICVLTPLFSVVRGAASWEFSLPQTAEPALSEEAGAYAEAGRRTAERIVDETVRAFTDVSYRTEISVHIQEDMRIDIESVRVIFERRFDGMQELAFQLKNRLGVAPEMETEAAE